MNSDHPKPRPGLSRREFLKGGGIAAAASALTPGALVPPQPAQATQAPASPAFGPDPVRCELTVNGVRLVTQIEPRVTLLDALRNYLDITGPKRVCDRGTCGACTVLLDGKPVYACMCLALEAMGRQVETAESLGSGDKLDPVPAAFVQFDAQQCGFCTPGFVMAVKAALARNRQATPEEVEAAVSGNICRCGTYQQMREAIRSLCRKFAGWGQQESPAVAGRLDGETCRECPAEQMGG
jgi:xanthine dehydrogenase YagT iron-sulfur-binding subunit